MKINITNKERKKLDAMFKNVLSIKEFLAIIMKETIDEYKDEDLDKIIHEYIEGHVPIDDKLVHPKILGANNEIIMDDKKTAFDIKFYARLPKSEDRIGIVINIEIQSDFYPGYHIMNRAHYYNARNISVQFETFMDEYQYDNLRKVVGIWLMLNPPQYMSDGINRYVMKEEHVFGNVCEDETLIRKNEIIMVYLSRKSTSKLIQLLNELRDGTFKFEKFYETLTNDYGYKNKIDREKEVIQMYEYGQYVINKGIEQGKLEFAIEQLQKRMKKMNFSLEEAMIDLDYDMKDYDFYKSRLNLNI